MKRLLVICSLIFLLFGCDQLMNTPIKRTEEFLAKYQLLDQEVLSQIDTAVEKENFTSSQIEKYKEVLKRQYKDLTYKIEEEETDGNKSEIDVSIEVYDYAKIKKDANKYIQNNPDKFMTNDATDLEKVNNYIIDKLNDSKERIKYMLEIKLEKGDKKWKVQQISDENLKKINGFYTN